MCAFEDLREPLSRPLHFGHPEKVCHYHSNDFNHPGLSFFFYLGLTESLHFRDVCEFCDETAGTK